VLYVIADRLELDLALTIDPHRTRTRETHVPLGDEIVRALALCDRGNEGSVESAGSRKRDSRMTVEVSRTHRVSSSAFITSVVNFFSLPVA